MTEPMIDAEEIREQLVQEFGLSALSEEKQKEALEMAFASLIKVIYAESMAKIGESGIVEYEALLEKSPSDDDIAQFFRSRIPEYDNFVAGIVREFKETVKLN